MTTRNVKNHLKCVHKNLIHPVRFIQFVKSGGVCMTTILLIRNHEQHPIYFLDAISQEERWALLTAGNVASAEAILGDYFISLAVFQAPADPSRGIGALTALRRRLADTPVVVALPGPPRGDARPYLEAGAYDVMYPDHDGARNSVLIRNALAHARLAAEKRRVPGALTDTPQADVADSAGTPAGQFVGESPAAAQVRSQIAILARTPDPILITGETGVGKEVVARALHQTAGAAGPFVAVNLGGLDDHTISDTLFGHSRGAYTGAVSGREGLVRKAAAGTLFLDEFAEIAPETQVKLLRLVDQGEFMPLGSDQVRHSRARLIFATNRDLPEALSSARFRHDLFYRISAHWLRIPPLRERPADVKALLEHLMRRHARRLGLPELAIPPRLLDALSRALLPGNVRELEQLVVNALVHRAWDIRRHESYPGSTATPPATAASPSAEVAPTEGPVSDRPTPDAAAAHGSAAAPEDWLAGCPDPTAALGPDEALAFGAALPTPREAVDALIREADRRFPNNRAKAAAAIGLSPQAFTNRWKRLHDRTEGEASPDVEPAEEPAG